MQWTMMIDPTGRVVIWGLLFGTIGILFRIVLVRVLQAQLVDVHWEGPSEDPLQVELKIIFGQRDDGGRSSQHGR